MGRNKSSPGLGSHPHKLPGHPRPVTGTVPINHPQGSLLNCSWEDSGMKYVCMFRGAESIPNIQPTYGYISLWFYYHKHTMAPSHPGNLHSTCSIYPFSSTWAGPYRSVRAMCGYKTCLTGTVQLIAYSDTISPAVQERYRNMPGLPRMRNCLIHICELCNAAAPLFRPSAQSEKSTLWRGPFWTSEPGNLCIQWVNNHA